MGTCRICNDSNCDSDCMELDRIYREHHRLQMQDVELSDEEIANWEEAMELEEWY